jgi:predicted LPLAT superfamily acyltransferase
MGASSDAASGEAGPTSWSRIGERGSLLGIRFTAWCYRVLGRRGCLPLVYAIVTYFFVTDTKGRRASLAYLRRVHATPDGRRAIGHRPGILDSYRHYCTFALAIVDRLALWFGELDDFEFEMHGSENIDQYTEAGRGALILGAHLGSFDVLRRLAQRSGIVVNVVMFTANAERINTIFREISPEAEARMIAADPTSVRSVFAIRERGRCSPSASGCAAASTWRSWRTGSRPGSGTARFRSPCWADRSSCRRRRSSWPACWDAPWFS